MYASFMVFEEVVLFGDVGVHVEVGDWDSGLIEDVELNSNPITHHQIKIIYS